MTQSTMVNRQRIRGFMSIKVTYLDIASNFLLDFSVISPDPTNIILRVPSCAPFQQNLTAVYTNFPILTTQKCVIMYFSRCSGWSSSIVLLGCIICTNAHTYSALLAVFVFIRFCPQWSGALLFQFHVHGHQTHHLSFNASSESSKCFSPELGVSRSLLLAFKTSKNLPPVSGFLNPWQESVSLLIHVRKVTPNVDKQEW